MCDLIYKVSSIYLYREGNIVNSFISIDNYFDDKWIILYHKSLMRQTGGKYYNHRLPTDTISTDIFKNLKLVLFGKRVRTHILSISFMIILVVGKFQYEIIELIVLLNRFFLIQYTFPTLPRHVTFPTIFIVYSISFIFESHV